MATAWIDDTETLDGIPAAGGVALVAGGTGIPAHPDSVFDVRLQDEEEDLDDEDLDDEDLDDEDLDDEDLDDEFDDEDLDDDEFDDEFDEEDDEDLDEEDEEY